MSASAEAEQKRAERIAALVAAGVRVEDPGSTHVGPEVVVEKGAVLRPFTILEGTSVVRGGASVGPFVRLVDTEVGKDAQVLDHCLLRESVVEEGASVGPFSHLRPGSRVGAQARVGNFVELKKTQLGEGSKASHLSYLGDATIGPGVNIGAGTITCNYDGEKKSLTRIEANAFVGSVFARWSRPSRSATGRIRLAAGSAITEDVPRPTLLALGRARQVTKPGWAEMRRARRAARKDGT